MGSRLWPSAFDRIEHFTDRASGVISGIAVIGLLAGAIVIVFDVILRALGLGGVVALNEIMGQMFAMAVAATLPAGAARKVNLRVDLMAGHFGPRLSHILLVAGSVALLLFFGLLTYYVTQLGIRFVNQGRETLILKWPLGPTYVFSAIAMGLATLVQAVKVYRDVITAPQAKAPTSSLAGMITALALGGLILAGALWALIDLSSLQSAASGRPGRVANAFLGRIKGGLAYATIAGCAGFGAVSGSSVATAATFGRIALPEMDRNKYDAALASGTVAAGGTLGALFFGDLYHLADEP